MARKEVIRLIVDVTIESFDVPVNFSSNSMIDQFRTSSFVQLNTIRREKNIFLICDTCGIFE